MNRVDYLVYKTTLVAITNGLIVSPIWWHLNFGLLFHEREINYNILKMKRVSNGEGFIWWELKTVCSVLFCLGQELSVPTFWVCLCSQSVYIIMQIWYSTLISNAILRHCTIKNQNNNMHWYIFTYRNTRTSNNNTVIWNGPLFWHFLPFLVTGSIEADQRHWKTHHHMI